MNNNEQAIYNNLTTENQTRFNVLTPREQQNFLNSCLRRKGQTVENEVHGQATRAEIVANLHRDGVLHHIIAGENAELAAAYELDTEANAAAAIELATEILSK